MIKLVIKNTSPPKARYKMASVVNYLTFKGEINNKF